MRWRPRPKRAEASRRTATRDCIAAYLLARHVSRGATADVAWICRRGPARCALVTQWRWSCSALPHVWRLELQNAWPRSWWPSEWPLCYQRARLQSPGISRSPYWCLRGSEEAAAFVRIMRAEAPVLLPSRCYARDGAQRRRLAWARSRADVLQARGGGGLHA